MTLLLLLVMVISLNAHKSRAQEQCRNEGNDTHIRISYCDSVSYEKMSRDFEMKKVVEFYGGSNEFPSIDEMFQQMTQLVNLELHECGFESIDEKAFSNLKVLKVLNLAHNKIRNLHENTFRYLVDLEVLYLYDNLLEVIPSKLFETNRKLSKLFFGENKIKDIPVNLFAPLADLEVFEIGINEIEVIHEGTFRNNLKIQTLRLQTNKIRAIWEGTFDRLTQLTLLDVTESSCINKQYRNPIDFNQVSRDLTDCYSNYKNIFGDFQPPKNCSDFPLIFSAISTILSITGVLAIVKFIRKTQKVVKEKIECENVEMQGRESFHYYSKPDTPEQIEQARLELHQRELQPDSESE